MRQTSRSIKREVFFAEFNQGEIRHHRYGIQISSSHLDLPGWRHYTCAHSKQENPVSHIDKKDATC